MSPTDADAARERLRNTLQNHHTGDAGVVLDSGAWLITAHRTASIQHATTERNAP